MTKSFWWMSLASLTFVVGCDGGRPASDAGPGVDAEVDRCMGETVLCGNECVDTANDRQNCGGCDMRCAAGEACVEGGCGVICPAGQTACSGACFNTDTSRQHCGACGDACGAGEACVGGTCQIACAAGHTACGSVCADTNSDPDHCGGCDMACAAGEVCSEGACVASCGSGLVDCSGACVDLQDSPSHCGACGTACAMPTSTQPICVAGVCGALCAPLTGDCDGDMSNGCESGLETDPTSCGACNRECVLDNTDVAGCAAGACVVTTCASGFDDCDGAGANGCESELATDIANCGACGNACAATETCSAGTCITRVGEDCTDAFVLSAGTNTIAWTSTMADYLTTTPSCVGSSYSLLGPDVVMSYTATAAERVTLAFTKPTSTRWAAVVSSAACGTLSPSLACVSDFSPASMSGTFVIGAGETAYVYLRDTSSGAGLLDNPLTVDVTAVGCTDGPPATDLSPANGSTTSNSVPTLSATFGAPLISSIGVITLTGDMGTSQTFDLATNPPEVSFSAGNTVMTIEPTTAFADGETITVSWTGLSAVVCTTPVAVPPATWSFITPIPPCSPGAGGVVGRTLTRMAGFPGSTGEYFVTVDEDPAGWVYVGGPSELYRMPKAGGAVQDIESLAGLGSSHMGYSVLVDGPNIFTVDTASGSTGRLWRISTDGGATWVRQDYANFGGASPPADTFYSGVVYGGRIYLISDGTSTEDSEIWSVDANATTLPAVATLERTFTGWGYCNGVDRDTTYYYMVCGSNDGLIRVPVAGGGAPELIDASIDFNVTRNNVHGEDLDADGMFDVLYVQSYYEEAHYVCSPASSTPYLAPLVNFGDSSSNYGLGFDATANVLWMFDDDTDELITIQ